MSKVTTSDINQKVMIAAAIISILGLFYFLRHYFLLIAVSAILAYLMNPIYKWFMHKFKNSHGKAITLTTVALFGIIIIPIVIILAITVDQTAKLIDQVATIATSSGSVSETVNTLVSQVNEQADKLPFVEGEIVSAEQIKDWLQGSAQAIVSVTLNFVKSFAGGIASFFTTLIIFLFIFSSLLKNQKKIIGWIEGLNPLGSDMNNTYLKKMGDMTTAMVKGQFAIAVLQGLSGTISLWIAGIDYLAFWFVLLTFLSIIPLGGGILLIPLGIVMILTGNIWQGVLILAWHFLITTNIDNVLRPKFVPKSARLDPALTILSVFAGISIFGFLGIVLGPVLMIVLLTTIETYLDYNKKQASK